MATIIRCLVWCLVLAACSSSGTGNSSPGQKAHLQPAQDVLSVFKGAFGSEDTFDVNDKGDHYEIIVSHPSTESHTGGAEQYFLDKKTGKWRMGWHEHPMPMEHPESVETTPEPR